MKLVNGFNLFHESSKKIEDSSLRLYISKLDKIDLSIIIILYLSFSIYLHYQVLAVNDFQWNHKI